LNLNETGSNDNNTGISSAFFQPIQVKKQNVKDEEDPSSNDEAPAPNNNNNVSCFTVEYI